MQTSISRLPYQSIFQHKSSEGTNLYKGGSPALKKDIFQRSNKARVHFSGGGETSQTKGLAGVAGLRQVKDELMEEFILPFKIMQNPSLNKSPNAQAEPAYGLLLYGPPGNGKSFLAKKIAEEMGVPSVMVESADRQGEHIGQAEERLEEKFLEAEALAEPLKPCVMIFDEFDSCIPKLEGTLDDRAGFRQRRAQILTKLESAKDKNIFIISTTNTEPSKLDSAAVRAGRLDVHIKIPKPDHAARQQLFKMHITERLKKDAVFPLTKVQLEQLASKTEGSSASDIVNVCKKAARKSQLYGSALDFKLIMEVLAGGQASSTQEQSPEAHHRSKDYRFAHLQGKSFCDADLRGADFYKANLTGANLSRANCLGANFESAELVGVDFHKTNLSGANLRNANFAETILTDVDLSHANCMSANFSGTSLSSGTKLFKTNLCDVDFNFTKMKDVKFEECNIIGTSYQYSEMENIRFIGDRACNSDEILESLPGPKAIEFDKNSVIVVARSNDRDKVERLHAPWLKKAESKKRENETTCVIQ